MDVKELEFFKKQISSYIDKAYSGGVGISMFIDLTKQAIINNMNTSGIEVLFDGGFDDAERIKQSVNLLVDPTNNSINEKCSRIREAFVLQFSDEIAQYYYITGDRLSPKHIELDRSLVVWECEL